MSARGLLRLVLVAGLLTGAVSTAEAGKAKDARFVNPSKPEGKVKAVPAAKGLSRNVRSAPTLRGKSASNASNYVPPNKPTAPSRSNAVRSGGSRDFSSSNKPSRNYNGSNNRSPNYKSSNYAKSPNYKSSGGYKSNNKSYYGGGKRYSSCDSDSNVSISIGLGYSSYGSYVGGSYYSGSSCAPSYTRCAPAYSYCGPSYSYCAPSYYYGGASRCYYPYTRWGYGWGCSPWGWGPSFYCPVTPVCAPATSYVAIGYGGGACFSAGGGSYYTTTCRPLVYTSTAYEVQAQPSVVAYHDWQQSMSSTSNLDAVVLPAPAQSPVSSAQQWEPSGRQVEATQQGWTLVAEGKARAAVAVFAVECEMDGNYAPAKVGYAIASALAGEGAAARWGMRRAFATPTPGIAYLPSVAGLTDILNVLSGSMWREMAGRQSSADDWFLLASIDYLRHDLASAQRAAQQAASLGDDSPSLLNLRSQIQAEAGN